MKSKRFRLNSLDQHFFTYETDSRSFVSHEILETETAFDQNRVLHAIQILLEASPYLRSRFDETYRYSDAFTPSELTDLISNSIQLIGTVSRSDLPEVLPVKIDLTRELSFKVTLGNFDSNSFFLAFTAHHAAMDGMGQALLAQEFLLAYQDLPVSSWLQNDENFTFQNAVKNRFSFLLRLKFISKSFLYLLNRSGNKGWAQSLAQKDSTSSGKLKASFIAIDEKEAIVKKRATEQGFTNVFSFVLFSSLRAFVKVSDQTENRITVITPVNLRHAFRERKSFQNIDGLARVHVTRAEVQSKDFGRQIDARIKNEVTPEKAFSLILLLGLASRIFSFPKLKSMIQKQEQSTGPVNSSLFISFGNFPRFKMNLKRVYGFGSLTRSPGLGIILVGLPGKQVLSVEYLENLVPEAKVQAYTRALCLELFGSEEHYF